MAAISWPGALKPSTVSWHLENVSRSGGVSLTGTEQIVAANASRWRCSLGVHALRSRLAEREDAVLALRAFVAQMQGRVGEVLLPAFDGYRPRGTDGKMLNGCHVAPLDGPLFFFEHWGFGQDDLTHATLDAAVSLGATSITVNVTDGQGPRPGHYFGIGERMYIARHVYQDDPDDPVTIKFLPRLRAAASSGDRVILDRPVCTMRLASDDTGELEFQMRKWAQTTIEFVEAF